VSADARPEPTHDGRHVASDGERPGEVCYLCGRPLTPGQATNRDHVPPRRLFARSIRKQFNPQLVTVRVHADCNFGYQQDEEYFLASVGPMAAGSPTFEALVPELRRGLQRLEAPGLRTKVCGEMGAVHTADGLWLKAVDHGRLRRVIWKIVRGLLYVETDRTYPDAYPVDVELINPTTAPKVLPDHPWFSAVRDTGSLADYGAVFDCKALGVTGEGGRIHIFAFLFWDRLIALVRFHDSACACINCRPGGDGASRAD
jgi:hypothetical protein